MTWGWAGSPASTRRVKWSARGPGRRGCPTRAVRSENGVLHDLGTLGGPFSEAAAINRRGDVVGWSNVAHGSARGFLYSGGRLINLGLPPSGLSSRALALNDAGVIVGSATTGSASARSIGPS